MKFFIDTANLDQIKEAQALGVLDGVTTNPSLMAKEGITGQGNILKHYVDICNIVDGDVSAEVISTDFEGMVKEGEALAALHPQIVVKVPIIQEGVKAIKYFYQFVASIPSYEEIKSVYLKMCSFLQVAYGEKPEELLDFSFETFSKAYSLSPTKSYNSLRLLDQYGLIQLQKNHTKKYYIKVLIDGDALADCLLAFL